MASLKSALTIVLAACFFIRVWTIPLVHRPTATNLDILVESIGSHVLQREGLFLLQRANDNWPPSLSAVTFTDFLPVHCTEEDRASQGLLDASILINAAINHLAADDASFMRYFQAADLVAVRRVLVALGLAMTTESYMQWITINYGTNVFPAVVPLTGCEDAYTLAYFTTATDTPIGINTQSTGMWPKPKGLLAACPLLFRMPDLASLTCDTVGTTTSWAMLSVGQVLMHELFHWDWLTTNACGHTIIDWNADTTTPAVNAYPPDGYGPFNAAQMNVYSGRTAPQYTLPPLGGEAANVDNYVWFAVEAYFRDKCGVDLVAAQNLPPPYLV